MSKIRDYQTRGHAAGLARISDEPFTIVKVQQSSYDGETSIRIMTQKPREVDGYKYSKIYTSKKAIRDTWSTRQLRHELDNTPIGPVE